MMKYSKCTFTALLMTPWTHKQGNIRKIVTKADDTGMDDMNLSAVYVICRGENGTDIFRPYSRSNPFRGVQICPYPSPDIQHPISYPYPNNQIAYLWCQYPIISYPSWLTISVFESEFGHKYENKCNINDIRSYPIRFHPCLLHHMISVTPQNF